MFDHNTRLQLRMCMWWAYGRGDTQVFVCVSGTLDHNTPNLPLLLLYVWKDVRDSGRSIHMGRGVGVTLITDPTLYTGQISRTGQDKEA